MSRTQFLARLLGLFFLVFAVAIAVNWTAISSAIAAMVRDPAQLTTWGMTLLPVGLALVVGHNRWRGITAIVVTLLGWATLLKGAFLLCAPPAMIAQVYAQAPFAHLQMFYVVVLGVLGLGLTAGGFMGGKTAE